ncbi:MAG TPA: response regulator [Acidobacteriota bacterium]|nr:response regulator [Acidobacteriota bacterium]
MSTREITAVIVDDERMARKMLRTLLAEHPHVQIVGEASNITQAIEVIRETNPEVVFLDIQMPGASGFELLNQVEVTFKVVFVTAFDNFALRAFEVNALHYLLKPVEPEALAQAIHRLTPQSVAESVVSESVETRLQADDPILLTSGERQHLVKISAIKVIHAEREYSSVVTRDGQRFLMRKSMSDWEAKLSDVGFVRIHRSVIINPDFIDRLEKDEAGNYQAFLVNEPEALPISRRSLAQLRSRLK